MSRIETKERSAATAVQVLSSPMQVRDALDRGDARQLRFEGFCSGGVDRRRVHTAHVEVADLLFVRSRRGLGARRGFQDLAQILLILVCELSEGAPARVFQRNRVGAPSLNSQTRIRDRKSTLL